MFESQLQDGTAAEKMGKACLLSGLQDGVVPV